jgi:hypothetical protein
MKMKGGGWRRLAGGFVGWGCRRGGRRGCGMRAAGPGRLWMGLGWCWARVVLPRRLERFGVL